MGQSQYDSDLGDHRVRVWPTGRGGLGIRAKTSVCTENGPLIFGSSFKSSFFLLRSFLVLGGCFGLGAGGSTRPPPPVDKRIRVIRTCFYWFPDDFFRRWSALTMLLFWFVCCACPPPPSISVEHRPLALWPRSQPLPLWAALGHHQFAFTGGAPMPFGGGGGLPWHGSPPPPPPRIAAGPGKHLCYLVGWDQVTQGECRTKRRASGQGTAKPFGKSTMVLSCPHSVLRSVGPSAWPTVLPSVDSGIFSAVVLEDVVARGTHLGSPPAPPAFSQSVASVLMAGHRIALSHTRCHAASFSPAPFRQTRQRTQDTDLMMIALQLPQAGVVQISDCGSGC